MKKTVIYKRWSFYHLTRNCFFIMTPFVLYSRVYLNYHSLEQVHINNTQNIFIFYSNLDSLWNAFWKQFCSDFIYLCYE